jgi:hypothetical protein
MNTFSRRTFFGTSAVGAAAMVTNVVPSSRAMAATRRWMEGGLPDAFPAQDPALVQRVVGSSHGNIDAVRELVTNRPALAKATWDWGFGDWETALGAASHVGRPDIAELLIANGARPDIFTFAMLGQVDVVRAICIANPGIQKLHGPHGITLLQHALNAGEAGTAVASYLEELGDADIGQPNTPMEEATAQAYLGKYTLDIAPESVFIIGYHDRRSLLTMAYDETPMRLLMNAGNHEFTPAGAQAVRITFDVADDRAKSLTIRDGDLVVSANRT